MTGDLLVVGVDLSLTCTGIALPGATSDGLDAHRTAAITRPAAHKTWRELDRLRRMRDDILVELVAVIHRDGQWRPTLVVVEGLAYSRITGHATTRAGLWWLFVESLDLLPCVVWAQVSPTARAKYATGKGNAGKDEVMRETARRFPRFVGREDEADAMVLRAMGCDWLGRPLAVMPATHRTALAAVQWPEAVPVADEQLAVVS